MGVGVVFVGDGLEVVRGVALPTVPVDVPDCTVTDSATNAQFSGSPTRTPTACTVAPFKLFGNSLGSVTLSGSNLVCGVKKNTKVSSLLNRHGLSALKSLSFTAIDPGAPFSRTVVRVVSVARAVVVTVGDGVGVAGEDVGDETV